MFIEIGSFEAKAGVSELLRAVKQRQAYTITARVNQIADLVSSQSAKLQNIQQAITAMQNIPKIIGVSTENICFISGIKFAL